MQGIYFIDAETVPMEPEFPEGTPAGDFFKKRHANEFQQMFDVVYKGHPGPKENIWQTLWERYAGLSAEFCKIVSISVGVLTPTDKTPQPMFYVKTFPGRDEVQILKQLGVALINAKQLGGHNILEFDGPVLLRRYLINGLPIPPILDTMTKKTWDIPFVDTMKMYSGSAWNYKISLAHLAHLFGIQSPKENMAGGDVARMYYSDGLIQDEDEAQQAMAEGLRLIGEYNAGDVICSARVFARMRGYKEIKDVDIFHIKPTPLNEPQG